MYPGKFYRGGQVLTRQQGDVICVWEKSFVSFSSQRGHPWIAGVSCSQPVATGRPSYWKKFDFQFGNEVLFKTPSIQSKVPHFLIVTEECGESHMKQICITKYY